MRPIQPLLDRGGAGRRQFLFAAGAQPERKAGSAQLRYLKAREATEAMLPALAEHKMPVTLPRQRPALLWMGHAR